MVSARATAPATTAGVASEVAGSRITSLDIVRGVAMILMAIDHVRVYSGLPAGGPTPGIFFTRWVTHFVAPAFVFLAGTGACLYGSKLRDTRALSRFLWTRGLWLVFLELTVIRVAWTFNLDYSHYMIAGVIWMIGWCMIIMAAAVYMPVRAIGAIGLAIIALHNVSDLFAARLDSVFGDAGPGWILQILYFGGVVKLGPNGPPLFVLFVIVPWIGVMMAGYAFGGIMKLSAPERKSISIKLGVAATLLFVVLRIVDVYGDPRSWAVASTKMPVYLAFLATSKYPASLEFLLMTLGPMFIFLGLVDGWRGRAADVIATFGRVPFFYYLLHIPLIHGAACVVSLVREHRVDPWLLGNHPMDPGPAPAGYVWSLPLLYLVWVICVSLLYVPCAWYARIKSERPSRWLTYL
jgi:uncharacterized membrane protein